MKKKISFGYILKRVLPLSLNCSPKLYLGVAIIAMIYSVYGVVIIESTSRLINSINEKTFYDKELLKEIALLVIIYVSKEIIGAIINYLSKFICEKSVVKFSGMVHKKAKQVDPLVYENPSFLDFVEKADEGIYAIPFFTLNVINLFFYDIPYLILIGLFLLRISPVLFLVPLCISVPVFFNQFIKAKYQIKYIDEGTSLKRKKESYKSYLCDINYFKETRHLGCFSYFFNLYMYVNELLVNKQKKLIRKEVAVDCLNKMITLFGYTLAVVLLYKAVISNVISIAIFAVVFHSLNDVHSNIENIISNRLAPIVANDYSSIVGLVEFLGFPDRKYGKNTVNGIKKIELKDVEFSYPGRKELAISGINIEIHKGELVAIVGENGSGKTTLSKLLLGIYNPTNGKIIINGKDAESLSYNSLFACKSAVFQNYYKYYFNLGDNISISDYSISSDLERIDKVARLFDISGDLSLFANGYETVLSKNFGGTDLSGGEWQRIAISRGFYRKNSFIVLDEPTAMIDPLEEGKIYDSLIDQAKKGRILVIVTHRMAAVTQADKVIYLNAGKIVKVGKHSELMEIDSYKKLYSSQANWYI